MLCGAISSTGGACEERIQVRRLAGVQPFLVAGVQFWKVPLRRHASHKTATLSNRASLSVDRLRNTALETPPSPAARVWQNTAITRPFHRIDFLRRLIGRPGRLALAAVFPEPLHKSPPTEIMYRIGNCCSRVIRTTQFESDRSKVLKSARLKPSEFAAAHFGAHLRVNSALNLQQILRHHLEKCRIGLTHRAFGVQNIHLGSKSGIRVLQRL